MDMSFVQRFSVEHGKLVHGKVHGLECHLLRDRAQAEERGDGGKVLNKKAKQGWRFAADAAMFTDENAGSEDCKHTSGGVSLATGNVTKKKEHSRLLLEMR